MKIVESVEGLWRVAVEGLTRANAQLWRVWRVFCHPYVCACARVCVYVTKLSTLSTLSTVTNYQYKKQLLSMLIVCLNFNQTLHKPSTGNSCGI
jgi:hypothetical protein